jgi:hypothetical protein
MNTSDKIASTHDKALQINLDPALYGTFAEIGAGQEVARWFFTVGGAAGTVAKTMSAYDMAVSDAIYGTAERYVSRARLQTMLDHEWNLLLQRLAPARGHQTCFFVFADTVATRSYTRQEDGRGWMGLRFQTEPGGAPSEIRLHVRLWDQDNVRQQDALGILGVNLLHAAFYCHQTPDALIGALMEGLTRDRVEVDVIKFSGAAFTGLDARLMSLQLVHQRLTNAAIFTAESEAVEPAEVLHGKPVLIERGSFRPVTNVTLDMLERALGKMSRTRREKETAPVVLMEMTLRHLAGAQPGLDHADFLARADILGELGQTVMISNYSRFHNVAAYLRRYTRGRIAMVMGLPTLARIFDEQHYADLDGGILEALGRLFKGEVTLQVYPWRNPANGEWVTAENFAPPAAMKFLYAHLLENGFVEGLPAAETPTRDAQPQEVLRMIQRGDAGWELLVPAAIVQRIKRDHLFGWKPA